MCPWFKVQVLIVAKQFLVFSKEICFGLFAA